MNKLSTYLVTLITMISGMFIFLPSVAIATDVLTGPCNNTNAADRPAICGDNQTKAKKDNNPIFGPDGLATRGLQILTFVVGVVSVIAIMVSGINMIASSGNSDSVSRARKGLVYAVVGLLIALMAQAIISFVLSKV